MLMNFDKINKQNQKQILDLIGLKRILKENSGLLSRIKKEMETKI